MKLTPITILFVLFCVLFIALTVSRFRRDTIGIRAALLWVTLWFFIGLFSLFPSILDWIVRFAQMEVRIFFVLVVAVFMLFALVFNISSRLDKTERNIGKLVQELALLNQSLANKDKQTSETL